MWPAHFSPFMCLSVSLNKAENIYCLSSEWSSLQYVKSTAMGSLQPATFKILLCRWELFSRRWKMLKGLLLLFCYLPHEILDAAWPQSFMLGRAFRSLVSPTSSPFSFWRYQKEAENFVASIGSLLQCTFFCVKNLTQKARVEPCVVPEVMLAMLWPPVRWEAIDYP